LIIAYSGEEPEIRRRDLNPNGNAQPEDIIFVIGSNIKRWITSPPSTASAVLKLKVTGCDELLWPRIGIGIWVAEPSRFG
jgi:hypothetical protein